MKYIKITPPQGKTAIQQAKDVSRELFKISRPNPHPEDVTKYQFGWIEHPTTEEVALVIDEEAEIPVSAQHNLDKLEQLLKDEVPGNEIAQLRSHIGQSNRVRFGDIIPSTMTKRSKTYMNGKGWFPESEI